MRTRECLRYLLCARRSQRVLEALGQSRVTQAVHGLLNAAVQCIKYAFIGCGHTVHPPEFFLPKAEYQYVLRCYEYLLLAVS